MKPGDGGATDDSDVWSEEQREALMTSYSATPLATESFWRVVARGVPGKSAMQCACKYQETLGEAEAVGAAGGGAAVAKGGKPKPKPKAKQKGGDSPVGARAALEAAALSKRGRSAREQTLRAAGREVRKRRREADAEYARDAFDEAPPQAAAAGGAGAQAPQPARVAASLAAAAAATGTERLRVPEAPPPARREARQTDAYVEQTLRRSKLKVSVPPPSSKAASAAAAPPARAPPPPPPPKGDVRALIDSIAANAALAAREEEEAEDDSEERDDYFSS